MGLLVPGAQHLVLAPGRYGRERVVAQMAFAVAVVLRLSRQLPQIPANGPRPPPHVHDDQRVLIDALQQLPARQREALVLRHWLGLKESEIASAMGISCGSVKTHTARGLAALTQAMEARR